MKNKGFTLTELLAVIVVLGIIVAIAVPSYFVITNNTKRQLYQNKIDLIKTQAIKYAEDNDTENETISVARLIDDGYIGNDSNIYNQYQQLVNPFPEGDNDKYMDCYTINIIKNDGGYSTEVNKNNDCASLDNLNDNSKIRVYAYQYSNDSGVLTTTNVNNKWSKNDVVLFVKIDGMDLTEEQRFNWSIGGNSFEKVGDAISSLAIGDKPTVDTSNTHIVNASLILNTDFKVSYISNEGIISKSGKIKIDKELPSVSASVDSTWLKEGKKANLSGGDGNGSGIKGYFVSSSLVDNVDELTATNFNNINYYSTNVEGEYFAYSMDNVGNVSEPSRFEIVNIDKNTPTCVINMLNNDGSTYREGTWTNQDVKVVLGCSDSGVGCKTSNIEKEYKANNNESKIYSNVEFKWNVEDNLGNNYQCNVRKTIKIDKVKPTCTNDNYNNTQWTKNNRSLKYGCSDIDSTCSVVTSGTIPITTTTTTVRMNAYTITDKAGNVTSCPAKTIGAYVDKELPKCKDAVGNTTWRKSDYTLSYGCNDYESGCATSDQSAKITTTEKTHNIASYTIKDKAGNKVTCPAKTYNVYVDKTYPTCTVSGAKTNANSNVELIGTCSDRDSTCVSNTVTYTVQRKPSAVSGYFSPGKVKDKAGNETTCEKKYVSISASCTVTVGTNKSFSKGATNYTVPCSGTYKIELWGAGGGQDGGTSGKGGAYLSGTMHLNKDQVVVFTVGGQGTDSDWNKGWKSGGYNGGGNSFWSGGGGGRTDIKIGGTVYAAAAGGGGATHGLGAREGGRVSNSSVSDVNGSFWQGQSGYGGECTSDVGGGGAGFTHGGASGIFEDCSGARGGYGGISGYRSEFKKIAEYGNNKWGNGSAKITLQSID